MLNPRLCYSLRRFRARITKKSRAGILSAYGKNLEEAQCLSLAQPQGMLLSMKFELQYAYKRYAYKKMSAFRRHLRYIRYYFTN